MKFLIISPAKNEGEYIEGLIRSMILQDKLPEAWVIVNDGSTDDMAEKIKPFTEKYDWIHLINRDSAHEVRSGGSKVVRAFYHGYNLFKDTDHDVVMKLDGDLTLPSDYLSSLEHEFKSDKWLGLCGGYCVIPNEDGAWQRERSLAHHVRGALKAYRKEAFQEMGGITETWNWDGLDNMKIMHAGWKVKVIEKSVKHHRPTSAAYEPKQHAYRSGVEAYRTGSDLGLALIRSAFKIASKPYLANSYQYIKGYLAAKRNNEPKVVDAALERFIRKFNYQRILSLDL